MVEKKKNTKVRAYESHDACRLQGDVPLIVDNTELITPERAQELLKKNKSNRPVNWNKVDEYREIMEAGQWKVHAQGIILDPSGNLITGQKRLLAIIYCGIPQYMRVSRGTPADVAHLIDLGTPQSSRDLASRKTERKHSPTEASIVRAILAAESNMKPSKQEVANALVTWTETLGKILEQTRRIKKNKAILMIMAAMCMIMPKLDDMNLVAMVERLASALDDALLPLDAQKCWGRAAAFTLAMQKALEICRERRSENAELC